MPTDGTDDAGRGLRPDPNEESRNQGNEEKKNEGKEGVTRLDRLVVFLLS
jgi:hypothetical protein